jgi:peptidoglycan/xylan/chitin deacetylase (PgdA/CDA1 family)
MTARSLCLGAALAAALASPAWAGGPAAVALIDRALWPHPLATAPDFDRASFAENLAFAKVFFAQTRAFDEGKLELPVKQVQTASLLRWRGQVEAQLVRNLNQASAGCGKEPLCALAKPVSARTLGGVVAEKCKLLEQQVTDWFAAAQAFYAIYVAEQMRLAALFPKPTSEILTLSDRELTGQELGDKTFLLTFDDGPTSAGGETDKLTELLRKQGVSAEFFVMHGPLSHRLAKQGKAATAALYRQHCLAVHGKEHKPHPGLATWKESLTDTQALAATVKDAQPGALWFRPPYGQRTQEIADFVAGTGGAVVLWNIDSQDWHARLPAEALGDRVLTLMLLWRRGIILFHDTHAKAAVALPRVLDVAKHTGVTWQPCEQLAAAAPARAAR